MSYWNYQRAPYAGSPSPGAMPVECKPLSLRRVELDRRTDCARVGSCTLHAAKMNWEGFTCAHCGVRETSERATPMREHFDGALPVVWP